MKKIQRIFALIGVILLIVMYALTLIFAFIDSSEAMSFFKISIACTFFFPVILYAITIFYKLSHKDSDDEEK